MTLYRFLRGTLRIVVRQFFLKIQMTGQPRIEEGPLIIAATHPNLAVDPVLIGTIYQRETFFIAKSTLFKNPMLGSFFRALHMIPIYRPLDKVDVSKNEDSFRAAAEVLQRKKALVIFPEGISHEERTLLSLKTGAARIAFLAEKNCSFELGVKIQPVSITYAQPRKFQSSVTITFGQTLSLSDYTEQYRKNEREAVQSVTDDLEAKLSEITIHLKTPEHQELIEKIATVFHADSTDDRTLFKNIADRVEELAPKYPDQKEKVLSEIDTYLSFSSLFYLDEFHPYVSPTQYKKFERILLSPIVLVGILTHFVPYYFIRFLTTFTIKDPHNLASAKILLSLLLFPLWYLTLSLVVYSYTQSIGWAFITIAICIVSGLYTNRFLGQTWLSLLAVLWPGKKDPIEMLDLMRTSLQKRLRELAGVS